MLSSLDVSLYTVVSSGATVDLFDRIRRNRRGLGSGVNVLLSVSYTCFGDVYSGLRLDNDHSNRFGDGVCAENDFFVPL